jgi:hypothetical protein
MQNRIISLFLEVSAVIKLQSSQNPPTILLVVFKAAPQCLNYPLFLLFCQFQRILKQLDLKISLFRVFFVHLVPFALNGQKKMAFDEFGTVEVFGSLAI